MRTAAILPVKRFTYAKSRLGVSVVDPLRTDLARAMVGDVLTALGAVVSIERTIVVTAEESVAKAASYLGALVVPDVEENGQSAAVALGVAAAKSEGFERVLCVPGDCPALDPSEIDLLLGHPPPRAHARGTTPKEPNDDRLDDDARDEWPEITIVPDRHGTGTNGLLLAPPDAIAPSFGPDSCERHRALAGAAGACCRIERPASLLLDIDTGDDLQALRERLVGEHVRAPRTRTVLGLAASANATSNANATRNADPTPSADATQNTDALHRGVGVG